MSVFWQMAFGSERKDNNMQEYVVGFLFNEDRNLVVLIEKNRPAWQKGKLNGVGGHIETGEDPVEAMAREFREETGLEEELDWQPRMRLINVAQDWTVFVFVAFTEDSIHKVKSVTDEGLWLCKYPYVVDDKTPPLMPNLNWMMPLVLDDLQFPLTIYDNGPY